MFLCFQTFLKPFSYFFLQLCESHYSQVTAEGTKFEREKSYTHCNLFVFEKYGSSRDVEGKLDGTGCRVLCHRFRNLPAAENRITSTLLLTTQAQGPNLTPILAKSAKSRLHLIIVSRTCVLFNLLANNKILGIFVDRGEYYPNARVITYSMPGDFNKENRHKTCGTWIILFWPSPGISSALKTLDSSPGAACFSLKLSIKGKPGWDRGFHISFLFSERDL